MKKASNTAFSTITSSSLSSFSMSDKSNKKSSTAAPPMMASPQTSGTQPTQRNNSPGLPNVNDNTDLQQNKLPKMNSERMSGNQGHRLPVPHSQNPQSQSTMQTQSHPQLLMNNSNSEKNGKLSTSILNSNNTNINNPNINIPVNGNSINDKLNSNSNNNNNSNSNVMSHHKKLENDKMHIKKDEPEDEEDDDLDDDDDDDDDFDKKIASSDDEVEMVGNISIVRKEKNMSSILAKEDTHEERAKYPSPKNLDIDHKMADKSHDAKEARKEESLREDKSHTEKMDIEETTLAKGEVPVTSQSEKVPTNNKKRKATHDDENYDEDD